MAEVEKKTQAQVGDSTLKWAAGNALNGGRISQEDYKEVIERTMTLDEAVRRVRDGETESATAKIRRTEAELARARRGRLAQQPTKKEDDVFKATPGDEDRVTITGPNAPERKEDEVEQTEQQETTVVPVDENGDEITGGSTATRPVEMTEERTEGESPKWTIAILPLDDQPVPPKTGLFGKLKDAKELAESLFDAWEGPVRVEVLAHDTGQKKKVFVREPEGADAAPEEETPASEVAAEPEPDDAEETPNADPPAVGNAINDAAPAKEAAVEPKPEPPKGTATAPTDPDALPKNVSITRDGTASVYVSSRTTLSKWLVAAKEHGAVEVGDGLVDVADVLSRKTLNIKVYDGRELRALIQSAGTVAAAAREGKVSGGGSYAGALDRIAEKLVALKPRFS